MVKLLLFFVTFVLIFKFIILNEILSPTLVQMKVDSNLNKEIGKKGTAIFMIGYYDYSLFDIDLERKTIFKKNISDENNTIYEVWCGPWLSSHFLIFCELDEKMPKGQYSFQFNDTFNYSGYNIYLTSYNMLNITTLDSDKIDIYSVPQTINVIDSQDTYELKFKIISYNQERLFLSMYDIPLNCKRKKDELICSIKKTLLEGYSQLLLEYMEELVIMFSNKNGAFDDEIFLFSPITFNFNVEKKDVYVRIQKLLTNYVESREMIAYETNVTNIPTIMTSSFELTFVGKEEKNLKCFFKNGENGPLLLLCRTEYKEILSLKEIKNDILKNDINAKYNFIIQPVNNNEKVNVTGDRNFEATIDSIYPNTLDFTSKKLYEIDIFISDPNCLNGITFNEDEEDLKCENLINIKRCNISKDHFKGKKNGLYHIKYYNQNFKNKAKSFFTNPISVTLSKTEEKKNNITERDNKTKLILVISIVGGFFVLVIIAVVIIAYYYKIKNADLKEEVLKTSFKEIE